MPQHNYVIANAPGADVRTDVNQALAAIASNNSGATEPGTTYAYQWWADTTTGMLKQRNAGNTAWNDVIPFGKLAASVDVQTFAADGTWTKPAGCTFVMVELISGGGGGGSGRRGATSTNRSGGGGGGGGGRQLWIMPASALGSTEAVTIGAGGTGGPPTTVDTTNGTSGTTGGNTLFGAHAYVLGGDYGDAGVASTLTAGGFGGGMVQPTASGTGKGFEGGLGRSSTIGDAAWGGGAGGWGNTSAYAGAAGGASAQGAGGGGGGQGRSSSNSYGVAGSGGDIGGSVVLVTGSAAGANGATFAPLGTGTGGGGGIAEGGAGGAGGNYGGGGGGGAGATNGTNSGAGGNGANGYARITSW